MGFIGRCLVGSGWDESIEKESYYEFLQSLQPSDMVCVYCSHPVTHEHQPYNLNGERTVWQIHRRLCPACEQTFGLLLMTMAPYQRISIMAQDVAVSLLSGTASHEQVLAQLRDIGVSISESTVRRWYERVRTQIERVLAEVSS